MTRNTYFANRITAAFSALMLSVMAIAGSVTVPADAHASTITVSEAA